MTIPLTILGGSDRKPGVLPEAGREQHALAAYKGVDLTVEGRPLVEILVERLRTRPEFEQISIAGPARVYEGLIPGVDVIDTDGSVAMNVQHTVDAFLERHADGPLAVIACDILPEPDELARVMADFTDGRPSDVWFPLVRATEDVRSGPSGWKPVYSIVPGEGTSPVDVLPGHLLIADPRSMRRSLLFGLLDLVYRTRNRPLVVRRRVMLRKVLLRLLTQDFFNIFRGHLPTLTWSVLRAGLGVANKLREGRLTQPELEARIGRVVLHAAHRRAHPERGVRLPILDASSLALDIDTEEEARAITNRNEARATSPRPPAPPEA